MNSEERAELVELAECMIIDTVRNEPLIPFHRDQLGCTFDNNKWTKSVTGEEILPESVIKTLVQEAADRLQSRIPAIEIKFNNHIDVEAFSGVKISPKAGNEWLDVLRGILGPSESNPARALSNSGTELFERIKSKELTHGFLSEQSVRHRIRSFGYSSMVTLCRELDVKRGLKLEIESKTDPKSKRHRCLLKFRVVSRAKPPPPLCPPATNPVFRFSGEPASVHFAFKRFIQEKLLELNPAGTDAVMLWAFDSLRSYWHCMPDHGVGPGKYPDSLDGLLQGCVVHPDMELNWKLGYHDYVWTVSCTVSRPWNEVLPEIAASLTEPDIAAAFGLSAEASNLLRWVRAQPKSKLLLGCTPIVEEAVRKHELRLGAQWPSDNLAALIEVLCDEITTRTPFTLKRIRWMDYSREYSRVRITESVATPASVVEAVARWLNAQGVARTRAEVQQALEHLLKAGPNSETPRDDRR